MSFSIAHNAVCFASASAKDVVALSGSVVLKIKRTSWGSMRTMIECLRSLRGWSAQVPRDRQNQSHKRPVEKLLTPKIYLIQFPLSISLSSEVIPPLARDLAVVAVPDWDVRISGGKAEGRRKGRRQKEKGRSYLSFARLRLP